jgi:hypothetical protein
VSRLWLGDRYVCVGDTLTLTDGYHGPATVVAILPIKDITEGALLIDPRTLHLVRCAGCDLSGAQCYIAYAGDSGLQGCCMPDELFPVIKLDAAHLPAGGNAERSGK